VAPARNGRANPPGQHAIRNRHGCGLVGRWQKSGGKGLAPRLVVVSNRVAVPSGRRAAAGGLAVGLQAALGETGGLWFGWSGRIVEAPGTPELSRVGGVSYAVTDLSAAEHQGYYAGFANRTLWPLFHYRSDLASLERDWWTAYRAVNRRFAEQLAPLLRPDDRIWVQDYHLIPLGHELRRLGIGARLGFFLHIPFPAAQLFVILPWHRQLAQDLCAYDVVGFQTETDVQQFHDYVERELGGSCGQHEEVRALGRSLRVLASPIGIDVAEMQELAASAEALRQMQRLAVSTRGRPLILGVDRLDYSKGVPERLRGYELLLREHEQHLRHAVFMQISAPSREEVPEYVQLREEVERLAGHINGRYGEADWVPLRYLNRTHSRRVLAGFYRLARVGYVTPLRDGLNLVAAEFVAAQDPDDPGVLVLSRFAGAAEILRGALIVNPHDSHDLAGALHRALSMAVEERRERFRTLLAAIATHDIEAWRRRFLAALAGGPAERSGATLRQAVGFSG
jgi:trehalose 6-phosphate synthase